jgi:hypothetical protein
VVLRVADQDDKAVLLAADVEKFFTEPHYDGYPAVLVRLPAVTRAELRVLIAEAYRCVAPTPKAPEKKVPAVKAPAKKAPAKKTKAAPARRRSR